MATNNSRSGGIGFLGILFIVFLVLKLTRVIDWSWWWVTAPLWGSIILGIVLALAGAILIKIGKRRM